MTQVAIVTGGTRGLGRAIVERLAADGWFVHFTYRSRDDEAQALLEGLGPERVAATRCDSSVFDEVKEMVERVFVAGDPVGVLVNNAGITRDQLLLRMSEDDWQSVIDTNLTGVWNFCRAASFPMFRQKSGSIVNMSSVVGLHGNVGQVNYAASKAGIIGLTKSLAKEMAPRGIRANVVAPGLIDTDMTAGADDKHRAEIEKRILLGRYGRADEVANVVSFLAGEESSYITGQVIQVDGGLSL